MLFRGREEEEGGRETWGKSVEGWWEKLERKREGGEGIRRKRKVKKGWRRRKGEYVLE